MSLYYIIAIYFPEGLLDNPKIDTNLKIFLKKFVQNLNFIIWARHLGPIVFIFTSLSVIHHFDACSCLKPPLVQFCKKVSFNVGDGMLTLVGPGGGVDSSPLLQF